MRRCHRQPTPARRRRPSRTCPRFSFQTVHDPNSNFPPRCRRPDGSIGGVAFARPPSARCSTNCRSFRSAAMGRRGCVSCGEQFPRGRRRPRCSRLPMTTTTAAVTRFAFATFKKMSTMMMMASTKETTWASSRILTDRIWTPGQGEIRRVVIRILIRLRQFCREMFFLLLYFSTFFQRDQNWQNFAILSKSSMSLAKFWNCFGKFWIPLCSFSLLQMTTNIEN